MGILNMTPDSFSGDGSLDAEKALRRARRLIREGADILDIGGESTRPGARRIAVEEEIRRVVPLIRRLAGKIRIPISVDTYKPQVARRALDAGASIINNIMGTPPDRRLLRMARDYNAGIVLMHIRGTPRTMQKNPVYADLISEIIGALRKSMENCLEIGIKSDRIIIDPGISFGKTVEHNLEIINRLEDFKALHKPVLLGTSRKSFIGKVSDKDTSHRLIGSVATVCAGIMRGAHIVRVHDVKAVQEAAVMIDAVLNETAV